MNAITLSITTMALGAMIGITGTHYHHMNTLVKRGAPVLENPVPEFPDIDVLPTADPEGELPNPAAVPAVELAVMNVDSRSYVPSKQDRYYDAKLEAFEQRQKQLLSQLADSNRSVDELTFRLDSYSDSFKPLRTESVRPRPLDSIAAPLEDGAGSGVLPNKR